MLWILSLIWLSILFVVVWYFLQVKNAKTPAAAHLSWFTAWTLMLLLFTFYIIFTIFNLDTSKLNFLTNSLIMAIVFIFIQIGAMLYIEAQDVEAWTPLLLRLLGPIRGVLTAILLSLAILLPGVRTPVDPNSIRSFTTTGYQDYDIYYEIVAILSMSLTVWLLPRQLPAGFVRIGAALYGFGWACEFISTALIPGRPDAWFIASWFTTALALPFIVSAVLLSKRRDRL
jgi:prepilin signal peptidase PulO-like enzyme (type II secretory pathway)